jgi:Uma2 family endonuclease
VPKVTVAAYAALPEREGVTAELIDGVVYEVQLPERRHVQVRDRIVDLLREAQREHGWPGRFLTEAGVEVLPGLRESLLGPDVALFTTEQVEGGDPDGYLQGPPRLAVEIRSAHDRARLIAMKVSRYQEAGTPLLWVVDPRPGRRGVTVYALGDDGEPADPRVLVGDAVLDGGAVLPGLRLPLPALFEGIR